MAITVDIPKAKDIWKDKIREARKLALEKLDVDFIRATEAGSDTSAIVTKKNTLRNLPGDVDAKTTTNEIKTVWNNLLN